MPTNGNSLHNNKLLRKNYWFSTSIIIIIIRAKCIIGIRKFIDLLHFYVYLPQIYLTRFEIIVKQNKALNLIYLEYIRYSIGHVSLLCWWVQVTVDTI